MHASLETAKPKPARDFAAIGAAIEEELAAITAGKRRRKIIAVLVKNGLGMVLGDAIARKLRGNEGDKQYLHHIGRRLRLAFEELGPTFIKLGQVLVTRQDLLPEPITLELEKLLDRVPPIEFAKIEYILERELPDGLETFEWIEEEPLGSASLAQVYKAKLKDGPVVAVKVVRPTVEKLFQTDIAIIKKMAARLQKRLPPELQAALDLGGLVQDYYSSAMDELDMTEEARKMQEMKQKYERRAEHVTVPHVYEATKSVLIMEYIDGWLIKDFPVDFLTFEERINIMIDLVHHYVQTMLDGHYHADAHGSNIMIDKRTKKAVIIDWGMTGRMDSVMAQILMRVILHIQLNQAEDAAEVFMELMSPTIYTDVVKLKDELRTLTLNYVSAHQGSSRYNYGRLVLEATAIGLRNYCKVPNGLALWAKGFSATEGTARWICPEISYGEVVEAYEIPILKSILGKRFNFRANASLVAETAEMIATFPRRFNKVLETMAENKWRMTVQVQTDPVTRNTLNQIANRLALSLIAFAIIMATGFIVASIPGGTFLGMEKTTIANIGLAVSVILVVFLGWRLFRTRKQRPRF
ncbi:MULTISPECIES: ABC1 kinase family protein [Geobacillus]|uniref:ABC transporter n=5 Tax=Geobacillus TaxID=129337 RepID=Q5KW75_GEOKA|nr:MULTISPECIES: AarF/UbiB family protein [Geobacillus]AUI37528.1 ABC transporter [[Bacillus] caldolyticus]AWO75099.1 AarF/ABC1/UbiB kinase family protein [Geobacillus thermoleovorans]EQB95568.1 ABC transporter [Geobacillus sp. A8]ESU72559.1 ABC transporter [Geobacillus sp. MAS1]KJE29257.1 RIO1 family protein [Geobacillus kaustophilus]